MKAIFRKSAQEGGAADGRQSSTSSNHGSTTSTRSLGPQYSVPPFPHPLPDRSLSLIYTGEGLLIVPSRGRVGQPKHAHSTSRHAPGQRIHTNQDVAGDLQFSSAADTIQYISKECSSSAATIAFNRHAAPTRASVEKVQQLLATRHADGEGWPIIHCYGIVGILRVFKAAYLLLITSRTWVGDYMRLDRPVYKCTGVLAIPLTAHGSMDTMTAEMKRQKDGRSRAANKSAQEVYRNPSQDDSSCDDSSSSDAEDDVATPALVAPTKDPFGQSLGAAATLRALQGRSERTLDGDRPAPLQEVLQSSSVKREPEKETSASQIDTPQQSQVLSSHVQSLEAAKAELEDKVVTETARQYARGEMWFTYDFDLTTPVQRKQDAIDSDRNDASKDAGGKARSRTSSVSSHHRQTHVVAEPWELLPLWRRTDRRFWHNEYLSRDLTKAGLHNLVLPMMQGYFQVTDLPLQAPSPTTATFDPAGDAMSAISDVVSNPRTHAQLFVISRRSKERAGLRYQRRGVDDQGQVANFVESEQILYFRRGIEESHVFSFLQFRGSIPLYWRQDPFSMKPPPQLEGSAEENDRAFAKHFQQQIPRYGKITCINLAEQHGKEGAITKAYKESAERLADPNVRYKAFDFHEECKGMRFERVSKLIDELRDREIKEMDCFWKTSNANEDETVLSRQQGAFRVSCLDCLDRTNVVQSAFARHVLSINLERLGIHIPEAKEERDEAFDFAFNDSWANNGDMISQIYAGTKALKGDFTRTGKRNLMGMMNDATNSVYRMVRGAVSDFFKQTVIDFQYGYLSLTSLERYNDNLVTTDPAEMHRLARVRALAIEACTRNVVRNDEKVLAGWTLFSPIEPNRVATPKLEEKVVILTTKALYSCGYDYFSERIAELSRIMLGDIIGIQRGIYILSPNEGHHPEDHWGIIVTYIKEERRLNTASIRSMATQSGLSPGATNFIAFRAVVDDARSAEANMEASSRFLDSAERTLRIKATGTKASSSSKNLLARLAAVRGRRSASETQPANSSNFSNHTAAASVLSAAPHIPTSHDIIDTIVEAIVDQCILAGACSEDEDQDFVKEKTIQSLSQANASASLFSPLIEGLKRRVWL